MVFVVVFGFLDKSGFVFVCDVLFCFCLLLLVLMMS
jgi:hypothetical protein